MAVDSILYSFPYIGFLLLFLFLAYTEEKYKIYSIRIGMFSAFLNVIFIGFRGYVGWDWYKYELAYSLSKEDRLLDIAFSSTYPGFLILIDVLNLINENYFFLQFSICTFVSIIFYNLFSFYKINVSAGFALMIGFCLNIQIDLLRNILSISLFFVSIRYIITNQFKKYILINLIGFSIHSSSIFYLPLYFILKKNLFNLFTVIFTIGIFNYWFIFIDVEYFLNIIQNFSPFLIEKFEAMSSWGYGNRSTQNLNWFILKLLAGIVLLYHYKKVYIREPLNIIFINLTCLNISSFLLLNSFNNLFIRFQLLLAFNVIFASIILLKYIKYKKLFIFIFILTIILSLTQKYDSIIFKYHNILFSSDDIEQRKNTFGVVHMNQISGK